MTGTATNATNVTLSDESTDTTCFPTFATSATGNQALQTGTNLTFNSNTGDLAFTSATISDHTSVGSAVTASESGLNVVGVVTATSFNDMNGVGINTANVRTGILDVAGIQHLDQILLLDQESHSVQTEMYLQLVLQQFGNRFLVSQQTTSYHSYSIITQIYHPHQHIMVQFVHVHVAGKAFYAHAGAWYSVSQRRI